MGSDPEDDEEVTMLGRMVKWAEEGIEFETDRKHRKLFMEAFGMDCSSIGLVHNHEKEEKIEECDF